MAGSARVTSLDALDSFAAAVRVFQDEAQRAIESAEMNIRAATDWTRGERRDYWRGQARRAEQQLHEAKLNLQRCQTFRGVDDYRPACVDEKRQVERTRRRLEHSRDQIEAVKHWSRVVDQAVYESKGGVSPLARWLETDVERAMAALNRICRTLQEYVAVAPITDAVPPTVSMAAEQPGLDHAADGRHPAESLPRETASDSAEEPT
jgi:hypothetical protein